MGCDTPLPQIKIGRPAKAKGAMVWAPKTPGTEPRTSNGALEVQREIMYTAGSTRWANKR